MNQLAIPLERHRLDNGLKIVLSQDNTVPIVAVNIWYGVGSRNELPGHTGFALSLIHI